PVGRQPRGGPCRCYPNDVVEFRADGSAVSDADLTEAVTADGLVRLLSLAEAREPPVSDVNRLVLRPFVPGYEAARRHVDEALAQGVVEPFLPRGYLYQSPLREIIRPFPGPAKR